MPSATAWQPIPGTNVGWGNDATVTPAPNSDAREREGRGDTEITPNVVRVTHAEVGAAFDPTLTPDGTHLVFASTQHRRSSDIYVQRVGSRVVTQLTTDPSEDAMPQVSPDGTRVAFASNRNGNWDVYIMPIAGGRAVQVTSDAADEIAPSWSPDGTQLVFSRMGESSGRWEMWVTDGRDHTTSSFIGFGLFPRWCPVPATGANGGDKIAFQVGRERDGRGFAIWTLDYARGNATNFTEIAGSASEAMINANWSPDGQWLVYAQRPMHAASDNTSLWMVGVDGSGRVRLTGDQSRALSPVWSPTGSLYFTSNRSGLDNVWSMDLSQAVAAARALTPPDGFVARARNQDGVAPKATAATMTASRAQPAAQPHPTTHPTTNADGAHNAHDESTMTDTSIMTDPAIVTDAATNEPSEP
jgi:Tol biopolymer transport system component